MTAYRALPLSLVDLSGIFHGSADDAPGMGAMRMAGHQQALDYLMRLSSPESALAVSWAGHSSLFFVTKRKELA